MFLAEIVFFGQDKGGRFTPPKSGFHPQVKIGEEFTSCIIHSVEEGINVFSFNIPYQVKINLMFPQRYSDKLSIGQELFLFEGSKQIAQGKITGEI